MSKLHNNSDNVLNEVKTKQARIIAITSGKGGVGKSSFALNIAIEFAKQNKTVCLLDADTNLANINIMTGLQPLFTLQDYVNKSVTLSQLALLGPKGIHIIPSASGLADIIDATPHQLTKYSSLLQQLENSYDIILIDTAAGINSTVLAFLRTASEIIFTITTEPTSLTDAFSLIKILKQQGNLQPISVLINKVDNTQQAKETYLRFAKAVKKYIGFTVHSIGYVINDRNVVRSIMMQKPFTTQYPNSIASKCLKNVANLLLKKISWEKNSTLKNLLEKSYSTKLSGQNIQLKNKHSSFSNSTKLLEFIEKGSFEKVEVLMNDVQSQWRKRQGNKDGTNISIKDNAFYSAMKFAQKLQ